MSKKENNNQTKHFFDNKRNITMVVVALFAIAGLLFASDFLFFLDGFDKHAHFPWENWPGFYGVLAFVACLVQVFVATYLLRPLVKRREDFYDRD